jgi:hypothetical protein
MKFKPRKETKWVEYHATRLNLIDSLKSHLESCEKINVYNNGSRTDIPLNTSGDYTLFNESMGVDLINKLIKKLYRDTDEKEHTKTQFSCDNIDNGYYTIINYDAIVLRYGY